MLCKLITTQYMYFGENRFAQDGAARGKPRRDWVERLLGHRLASPFAEAPEAVRRGDSIAAHRAPTMDPRPLP